MTVCSHPGNLSLNVVSLAGQPLQREPAEPIADLMWSYDKTRLANDITVDSPNLSILDRDFFLLSGGLVQRSRQSNVSEPSEYGGKCARCIKLRQVLDKYNIRLFIVSDLFIYGELSTLSTQLDFSTVPIPYLPNGVCDTK